MEVAPWLRFIERLQDVIREVQKVSDWYEAHRDHCREGCDWQGTSICQRCGDRLRCLYCGRYVREDKLNTHECDQMLDALDNCPICYGGNGSACTSHFV